MKQNPLESSTLNFPWKSVTLMTIASSRGSSTLIFVMMSAKAGYVNPPGVNINSSRRLMVVGWSNKDSVKSLKYSGNPNADPFVLEWKIQFCMMNFQQASKSVAVTDWPLRKQSICSLINSLDILQTLQDKHR